MKSLSGVGLGLSLVFGCLLVALVGELYYLLWWKKRRICEKTDENRHQIPPRNTSPYMFCCFIRPTQDLCSSSILVHEPQANNPSKDFVGFPPFGDGNLETFSGPPRFLFTIAEETKEDLESEDGIIRNSKNSTSRASLGDFIHILETPFLTPMASSPYFTPPLTPSNSCDQHNFGPFFESKTDAAFNKLRSSPPPKFKFLRDAEEKLARRGELLEEIEKGVLRKDHRSVSPASLCHRDEENGSFVTIIVGSVDQDERNMGRIKDNSKQG
ncbi:hypothetical protein F511_32579 [Dorcoceras hygrometricum]|uniref:Uncharacterized protein n=1 Tax=Dorcoceras hygrometricum TaxID=472368 RepID=A0A2Z7AW61_9LAMI|nr:hypothetical protein F511_32579 [Dorcoceras hygrometricum]